MSGSLVGEARDHARVVVGDVLTFTPPGTGARVTRRVVALDGGTARTQGDARDAPDPWTLPLDRPTESRVVLALPWTGENTDVVMRRYMLAFGLLMVVTFIKQPRTAFMKHVRPLLFGAYVLHPMVGSQLMRVTRHPFGLVALTGVLTLALVMGLRRTALRTVL